MSIEELKAENARLKAEVERLKAEPDALTAYLYADTLRRDDIKTLKAHIERLTNNCNYLDQKLDEELDKSAMLCGQVERLTKAGDAMADEIVGCFNAEGYDPADSDALTNWYAAKEGKPQP
jgi:predicted RNase H-like nuclease (RuvC/YqgF family)